MLEIPRRIRSTVGRGSSLFKTLQYAHETFGGTITIIETGTTRGVLGGGFRGDGWATLLWAWYADLHDSFVHTIDIDQKCLDECKRLTEENKNIEYVCMDALKFLKDFDKPVHLVYLDSAQNPNVMLEEFLAIEKRIVDNGYILLDDAGVGFKPRENKKVKSGKCDILGPYLLEHPDFKLIYHDTGYEVNQALFQKVK